jgi:hypothetical protein
MARSLALDIDRVRDDSAQGLTTNVTVNITNNSRTDVRDGTVGLQDTAGDSKTVIFAAIASLGGFVSASVAMKGPANRVLAHFDGTDGSTWDKGGGGSDFIVVDISLNDAP